jgi:hypothetical protein
MPTLAFCIADEQMIVNHRGNADTNTAPRTPDSRVGPRPAARR